MCRHSWINMLTLRELQEQFVKGLNSEDNAVLEHIKSNTRLSAKEHLAIYQSSIKGALQKALREIYSVCHKLVGDDFFIMIMNGYIGHNKSHSSNLAGYGEHLPDFIAGFIPAKSLPYLADVARMEWAWHTLYEAPKSKGMDFEKLASCYSTAGEKIIFKLPPGSTLLDSAYPVHQIWEVNQPDYAGDQTIILPDRVNYYYLIWSKDLVMRIDILQLEEWQILTWMHERFIWGDICDKVSTMLPNINLEEILPKLVQNGWIAEFDV